MTIIFIIFLIFAVTFIAGFFGSIGQGDLGGAAVCLVFILLFGGLSRWAYNLANQPERTTHKVLVFEKVYNDKDTLYIPSLRSVPND